MKNLAFLVALTILATGCSPADQSTVESNNTAANDAADTVYINGKIYTVNEAQPWVDAVAIKDGRFMVVGSNDDVAALTGDATEIVDLAGKFVMPGVHDTHLHPLHAYTFEMSGGLVFPVTLNKEEILEVVKQYAADTQTKNVGEQIDFFREVNTSRSTCDLVPLSGGANSVQGNFGDTSAHFGDSAPSHPHCPNPITPYPTKKYGGERGIRTPGPLARSAVFKRVQILSGGLAYSITSIAVMV